MNPPPVRAQFSVSQIFLNGDAAQASAAGLAGWLRLIAVCARRCNGGRIRDCRTWPVERWTTEVHVPAAWIVACVDDSLAMWDGDDLLLRGYDRAGEGLAKLLAGDPLTPLAESSDA